MMRNKNIKTPEHFVDFNSL